MKNFLYQQQLFFKQFRQNFFATGAILPSSRLLAGAVTAPLRARTDQPVRILEAGPGTGSFTGQIISCLQPGDTLDLIEINPNLVGYLKKRLAEEPAFQPETAAAIHLINADIRYLPFTYCYDYIIFSLPLSNFPTPMVKQILELMMARLKPGGIFSYVKYAFLGRLKYLMSDTTTRTEIAARQSLIQTFADKHQQERRMVLGNVPPTWVYYWQKIL